MSDEQLVSDVLSGIAWIACAASRKVVELRSDERLSGLTSDIDVAKTFELDYPSELPPGMYTISSSVPTWTARYEGPVGSRGHSAWYGGGRAGRLTAR
jgi:hypothetical protein